MNKSAYIIMIIEGIMIVAVYLHSMHKMEELSDSLNEKIDKAAEYSAEQGKKIDRILTSFEIYADSKASEVSTPLDKEIEKEGDERIETAISFLKSLKEETQQDGGGNSE